MAKTTKIEGTFEVKNDAQVVEAKKVIRSEVEITEATQHFPHKIDGGQTDVSIGFGGVGPPI